MIYTTQDIFLGTLLIYKITTLEIDVLSCSKFSLCKITAYRWFEYFSPRDGAENVEKAFVQKVNIVFSNT